MSEPSRTLRILTIDEDASALDHYRERLGDLTVNEPGCSFDAVSVELVAHKAIDDALDAVVTGLKTSAPFAMAFVGAKLPNAATGIKQMRSCDPHMQIVFVTDDSCEQAVEDLMDEAGTGGLLFLRKPLRRHEILQAARSLGARWLLETRPGESSEHADSAADRSTASERVAELEKELMQARKMEVVGLLARGVAHDFNNLLTVILGQTELLLSQLERESPLRTDIQDVHDAGERAGGLIKRMQGFSKRPFAESIYITFNELLGDFRYMLQRVLGEGIVLSVFPAENVGTFEADIGLMEQLLILLALRSKETMPQGGRMVIKTRSESVGEPGRREHNSVRPGSYEILSIADSGKPLDPRQRDQLHAPLLPLDENRTVDDPDVVGLHYILKRFGGSLWVEPNEKGGNTFTVFMPASQRPLTGKAEPNLRGNSETVMFVEDDDCVRKVAVKILTENGYDVLDASSGPEAIELAADFEKPIALLLTDVVMPEMTGKQLAEILMDKRPELKVLYMSGYADETILRHEITKEGSNFIPKPFTTQKLLAKIRAVLDGEPVR